MYQCRNWATGPHAHRNEGEYYQLQALHQSWPRKLPVLNLLARLREPLPLSLRHWHPGHKARQGAKLRHCGKAGTKLRHSYEKAYTCMSHHQRCCYRRVSTNQRHCHKSASVSMPKWGENANPKSRHRCERVSVTIQFFFPLALCPCVATPSFSPQVQPLCPSSLRLFHS